MRAVRAVAAVVLGTAATVVVLPSPAQAAETWDVPGKATITISGHGYGHGHGMSQYGAEGAAREGLGFRAIAELLLPRDVVGQRPREGAGRDLGRHHRRPGRARAVRTDLAGQGRR